LTLTGGSIAANSSCTVSVSVTAATPGVYTNHTGVISTSNAGSGASASAGVTFFLLPNLTVVSQANRSTAKPGEVIEYTITLTNFGGGVATNVIVTDRMSPHVALEIESFEFIEGTPPSGLTLGPLKFSSDGGSNWVDPPPPLGNITNWRIAMSGTMNANGGTFKIKYRAQVK
jgi:uncharacterized repeat protein (TIGR01451 family)